MSRPRVVRVTDPRGLRVRVVGDHVPDHLAAAYEQATEGRGEVQRGSSTPEVRTPSQRNYAELKRPELLKLVKERDLHAQGSNEELIEQLKRADES